MKSSSYLFRKRVWERALETFGDKDARKWVFAKQKGLGGKTPFEYATTAKRLRDVEDFLGSIQHGIII